MYVNLEWSIIVPNYCFWKSPLFFSLINSVILFIYMWMKVKCFILDMFMGVKTFPNSKKFEGHIAFGLFFCPSITTLL